MTWTGTGPWTARRQKSRPGFSNRSGPAGSRTRSSNGSATTSSGDSSCPARGSRASGSWPNPSGSAAPPSGRPCTNCWTGGLIEHRRCIGAFVRQADPKTESPPFLRLFGEPKPDLRDLIEVRLYLECAGVRYAAERADQDDIGLLEANLRRMRQLQEKGTTRPSTRTPGVHMNIAFATHNEVHIHLMRNFHNLILYINEGVDERLVLHARQRRPLLPPAPRHLRRHPPQGPRPGRAGDEGTDKRPAEIHLTE